MGENLLQSLLSGFYASVEIDTVPEIRRREFGTGTFGKKISSRHISFHSSAELNSFLREKQPFFISYSPALYERPSSTPMGNKGLIGADLVYEFDADDLKTPCKLSHDSWKCLDCSASGRGRPEACAGCGSVRIDFDEWVCTECIGETRRQTMKLLGRLEKDFGFSDGISVNFSGSKGFHTHVRAEAVRGLSKNARLELLDFITATNLDLRLLGFYAEKSVFRCPVKADARGWAGKLLEYAGTLLDSGDAERLAAEGSITVSMARKLLKEKQGIINGMGRGFMRTVPGVKAEKFWPAVLSSAISAEKLGVDRQTSIDIYKIVRVPGTIHGSTGLQAKEVPIEALEKFSALDEAVVMPESEVRVTGATAPRFYLKGKWFGPFNNESVSLPAYAAFYLLARGSAKGGA